MIGPHMNALSRTVRSRYAAAGAAALVALAALATAGQASAQEIQLTGPLAGAPAVRHERLYREGHIEFAPTVSFTLLDEYKRAILIGGRLQYNITDWLGVGVWGAFGPIQTTTFLTDQIQGTQQAVASPETAVNLPAKSTPFANQTAEIQWVAVPQVQFVPFRGKLAIFQKVFVDADAYLHGGVAFVGLKERGDCGAVGQLSCTDPASFALASRMAVTGSFGLGFNFYFGDFMALGVEYRALPFAWNEGGFDTRGGNPSGNFPDNKISSADQTFHFNQMLTLSLGFSFSLSDFSFSPHPHLSE